jgi:hypothetical protein
MAKLELSMQKIQESGKSSKIEITNLTTSRGGKTLKSAEKCTYLSTAKSTNLLPKNASGSYNFSVSRLYFVQETAFPERKLST